MPSRFASTRHLDLLSLLSKRPAKIDGLCRDLGISPDRLERLRGVLLGLGVNTIQIKETIRVTDASWPAAQRLAAVHLAYVESSPRLGSACH
jgi:hypothetical protein